MPRAMRLAVSSLLLLLGLATAATAAEQMQRVLAMVGDQVITSLDLERAQRSLEAQMAFNSRPGETPPNETQLRRLALERLIEDKVLEQEAKREKTGVGKEELDAFVERVKATNKLSDQEFLLQLASRGLTLEEYRSELKRDILRHKLIDRNVRNRVVISESQVERAYQDMYGATTAGQAGRVRLRGIFLRVAEDAPAAVDQSVRQRAEELRKQVAGGSDFAEMARVHSQGPGAAQGGEMGAVATGDLLPAMRQAVSDLKPGQLSQVIKLPTGYAFLQLLEKDVPDTTPASQELKESIRSRLENEALEKRFREWIKELRAKVFVKIIE